MSLAVESHKTIADINKLSQIGNLKKRTLWEAFLIHCESVKGHKFNLEINPQLLNQTALIEFNILLLKVKLLQVSVKTEQRRHHLLFWVMTEIMPTWFLNVIWQQCINTLFVNDEEKEDGSRWCSDSDGEFRSPPNISGASPQKQRCSFLLNNWRNSGLLLNESNKFKVIVK